jgi:hypothetical protein
MEANKGKTPLCHAKLNLLLQPKQDKKMAFPDWAASGLMP